MFKISSSSANFLLLLPFFLLLQSCQGWFEPRCEHSSPTSLKAGNITFTSISLDWKAEQGATQYRLRYSPTDVRGSLLDTTVTSNGVILTGLLPGAMYQVLITTLCDNGAESSEPALINIRTPCIVTQAVDNLPAPLNKICCTTCQHEAVMDNDSALVSRTAEFLYPWGDKKIWKVSITKSGTTHRALFYKTADHFYQITGNCSEDGKACMSVVIQHPFKWSNNGTDSLLVDDFFDLPDLDIRIRATFEGLLIENAYKSGVVVEVGNCD